MELLLCCVGTDLPGSPATIRATGHRRQSADTGFTGNETRSAAIERPDQTEVRESPRGMSTTHTRLLFCLALTGSMPTGHMSVLGILRGPF